MKCKECTVRFLLKKYLSLNFVKDSRVTKGVSKVEALKGIKLRRDSDKDSTEREKYVEVCRLTVKIP
jgi:hypothetical protein